jgi:predicted site-specific integrase-resolvase
MKLSLGQAAKQAGISKSTLSRLIKQGKVSAERQENGTLHIDASELDRLADIRATMHRSENVSAQQSDTPKETVLQREVELLRELLHDKERTIEDLRQERDAWRGQAERLSLTATKPERPEKPKGWWRRWWNGD